MIDYQSIIDELEDEKIMQLLDSLDIPYENYDDYILMPTICHNEDENSASWKLYYYKNTHLFMCYTECGGMNIFRFLKRFYTTRGIVYDWNKDILQVVLRCSAAGLDLKPNRYKSIKDLYLNHKDFKPLETFTESILNTFTKYYPPEWLEDGISPAAMDKYNIRYSISQNKIIIPHYNINGELIGIRGRALNKDDIELFGKYMPIQIEGKWYSHPLSLNLYGLNFNKEQIQKDKVAFLVESEKSVLQAESFKSLEGNHCIAVCGSKINKFHMDLLMKTCAPEYVVVCFDNEEQKGKADYFDKLYKMCDKYKNYCNMSFIYDREGLTNLKDSPTDRGEDIFIKLLEERVNVK